MSDLHFFCQDPRPCVGGRSGGATVSIYHQYSEIGYPGFRSRLGHTVLSLHKNIDWLFVKRCEPGVSCYIRLLLLLLLLLLILIINFIIITLITSPAECMNIFSPYLCRCSYPASSLT